MVVSPRYDQYKDAWDTSVVSEVLTLRSLTHHQIQNHEELVVTCFPVSMHSWIWQGRLNLSLL